MIETIYSGSCFTKQIIQQDFKSLSHHVCSMHTNLWEVPDKQVLSLFGLNKQRCVFDLYINKQRMRKRSLQYEKIIYCEKIEPQVSHNKRCIFFIQFSKCVKCKTVSLT